MDEGCSYEARLQFAEFFSTIITSNKNFVQKLTVPQLLTCKSRSGLDAETIKTNIISRFQEIGIPTGPLENGKPNVMEALVGIIIEEFVDSIQDDMRVDIAVDSGIKVQSNGANVAGPVASFGTSILPSTAIGVAR